MAKHREEDKNPPKKKKSSPDNVLALIRKHEEAKVENLVLRWLKGRKNG